MMLKWIATVIGATLMLVYMAPVVLRLKEVSLWVVVAIGAGMMLVDLWQSLKSDRD